MTQPDGHRNGTYSYLDYTTWDGPERWELIEGVPYMMASPTPEHQQILGELFFQFRGGLRDGSCTPYIAPLDVTFEHSDLTNTVVQPDLFVMCGDYIREKRIIGVPALVVEILSPSTAADDLVRKMNLYQRVGVQEYWVVEPDKKIINVYLREGNFLRWTTEHKPGDMVSSTISKELLIDVSAVFA